MAALPAGCAVDSGHGAGWDTTQVTPLKTEVPLADLESDLSEFIPAQMSRSRVPGLSIAVVREKDILWAKGFGVANSWTKKPVRSDTVFEAASFSKPIVAYVALKMTETGTLNLDASLGANMKEAYLPPGRYRDQITLRHVMTHSSGLSNDLVFDKRIHFEPGHRFRYSGVGFRYLQAVMEDHTGTPLQDLIHHRVFAPLDLRSNRFVFDEAFDDRFANGHGILGFPSPVRHIRRAHAAYSLTTTPTDIARFMIHLMNPELDRPDLLSRETISAMISPQFTMTEHASWGLGIGVLDTVYGDAFWHWGSNPGYQCFMIGYPAHRIGAVVMTNSDRGLDAARRVAHRALGGEYLSFRKFLEAWGPSTG